MGSSILIAIAVLIAAVLIAFGAGIAAAPLLLVVAAIPLLAALGRRYLKTKRVRSFRARSGLNDGIDDGARNDDEPIHGPTG